MWNPASRFLLTLTLITALSSFSPPGAAGDESHAAPATGIVAGVTSARPEPEPLFRADHPFMVIIEEKSSGSILFMARESDPGQS